MSDTARIPVIDGEIAPVCPWCKFDINTSSWVPPVEYRGLMHHFLCARAAHLDWLHQTGRPATLVPAAVPR